MGSHGGLCCHHSAGCSRTAGPPGSRPLVGLWHGQPQAAPNRAAAAAAQGLVPSSVALLPKGPGLTGRKATPLQSFQGRSRTACWRVLNLKLGSVSCMACSSLVWGKKMVKAAWRQAYAARSCGAHARSLWCAARRGMPCMPRIPAPCDHPCLRGGSPCRLARWARRGPARCTDHTAQPRPGCLRQQRAALGCEPSAHAAQPGSARAALRHAWRGAAGAAAGRHGSYKSRAALSVQALPAATCSKAVTRCSKCS